MTFQNVQYENCYRYVYHSEWTAGIRVSQAHIQKENKKMTKKEKKAKINKQRRDCFPIVFVVSFSFVVWWKKRVKTKPHIHEILYIYIVNCQARLSERRGNFRELIKDI